RPWRTRRATDATPAGFAPNAAAVRADRRRRAGRTPSGPATATGRPPVAPPLAAAGAARRTGAAVPVRPGPGRPAHSRIATGAAAWLGPATRVRPAPPPRPAARICPATGPGQAICARATAGPPIRPGGRLRVRRAAGPRGCPTAARG